MTATATRDVRPIPTTRQPLVAYLPDRPEDTTATDWAALAAAAIWRALVALALWLTAFLGPPKMSRQAQVTARQRKAAAKRGAAERQERLRREQIARNKAFRARIKKTQQDAEKRRREALRRRKETEKSQPSPQSTVHTATPPITRGRAHARRPRPRETTMTTPVAATVDTVPEIVSYETAVEAFQALAHNAEAMTLQIEQAIAALEGFELDGPYVQRLRDVQDGAKYAQEAMDLGREEFVAEQGAIFEQAQQGGVAGGSDFYR